MVPKYFLDFLITLFTIAPTSYSTSSSETTSTVDLGYAQYQATLNATTNVTNFLGVRYAAAPTGNLRWRAPQVPAPISGIQNASNQPSSCYMSTVSVGQTSNETDYSGSVDDTSSEDCLFLKITPDVSLPVIIWIYGGCYVTGTASWYDGSDLVVESGHNVISVVIQYRLSLLGFLAGEEVKQDGALNAGLLDQQFAFQWVQSHIASFGGDPTRVTIWGQSAGAGSVLQHIVANNGQTNPPLFRGGIISSSFLPSQYEYNHAIPTGAFKEVSSRAGYTFCYGEDTTFIITNFTIRCFDSSDPLSCLRSVDVNTLSQISDNIIAASFYGNWVFSPVVDGSLITQRVSKALQSGHVNGDALLAITNTNEGVIFVDASTNSTTAEYTLQLYPLFTTTQADQVAEAYANVGLTSLERLQAIYGESILICPAYWALAAFDGTSWKGEFAIPPAIHGQDLLYYFPSVVAPGFTFPPQVTNNTSFQPSFTDSFSDFILSLNPNDKFNSSADTTPIWPAYTAQEQLEMLFNVTQINNQSDIRAVNVNEGLISRCELWHELSAYTAQ